MKICENCGTRDLKDSYESCPSCKSSNLKRVEHQATNSTVKVEDTLTETNKEIGMAVRGDIDDLLN